MSDLQETMEQWRDAQVRGDVAALEELLDPNFTLVGPLGFVVPKDGWLAQFRSGALVTRSLQQDEVQVREYGDTAVVISAQEQAVEYNGAPNNGKFRLTQIFVRGGEQWKVAGIHFSPIAPPQQRG